MLQIVIGILIANLDLGIDLTPLNMGYNYLSLAPSFIGYTLILFGMRSIEKESTYLRQTYTRVISFSLIVLSIIQNICQLYFGFDNTVLRLFYMFITLFSYVQLYILSRVFVDVDATYNLKSYATLLITFTIVLAVIDLINMGLVFVAKNMLILHFAISIFTYLIWFFYLVISFGIYFKYREANK